MKKLSLYIHVPFCKHKCGYCDFLSYVNHKEEDRDQYVEYLLQEIELYKEAIRKRQIESIFFGGGTPSILGDKGLNTVLASLKDFQLSRDCEVTLEANPESLLKLDPSKLVQGGFNRLSLGVQSASPKLLRTMERTHTIEEAEDAFLLARKGGFKNINVDFISSVPGEKLHDVEESIAWIEKMKPEHVSLYSLILEEGTRFYDMWKKGDIETLTEEEDRAHVLKYNKSIVGLGLKQYEISNFAKPGYKCRQNLAYWTLGDYLGLGLGAHSNIGDERWWNVKDLNSYYKVIEAKKLPIEGREYLNDLDRTNEWVILRLRLNEGIFEEDSLPNGHKFSTFYTEEIAENMEKGLIEKRNKHYSLTERGRDLSNVVERSFFRLF